MQTCISFVNVFSFLFYIFFLLSGVSKNVNLGQTKKNYWSCMVRTVTIAYQLIQLVCSSKQSGFFWKHNTVHLVPIVPYSSCLGWNIELKQRILPRISIAGTACYIHWTPLWSFFRGYPTSKGNCVETKERHKVRKSDKDSKQWKRCSRMNSWEADILSSLCSEYLPKNQLKYGLLLAFL